jgi:hypothetical protein
LSPILYGNEKKRITPEVILLRIDQIAKSATPITANTEENIRESSVSPIPQAIANRKKAINRIRILMYLNINLVRVKFISLRFPTLCAAFFKRN